MQNKVTCALVSFGLAGHSEQLFTPENKPLSGWSTLSGYSKPDTWEPRNETAYDAAVILDNRALLEADAGLAWLSPMPCIDKARCKPLSEAGPIDFVSISDYVIWWANKGARVGKVEGGRIVWSDGEIQPKKLFPFKRALSIGLELVETHGTFCKSYQLLNSKKEIVFAGREYEIDSYLNSVGAPTVY